jgi:hypothetical protein
LCAALLMQVGFLELFSALTVAKKSLALEARLSLQESLALAGDPFQVKRRQ